MSAPIVKSLPPLDVWIAMKVEIRRQLGEQEWETWIRHARLARVIDEGGDDALLLISMPRNGKAIFHAMKQLPLMRRLARRMNFALGVTVDLDEWQIEQAKEKGYSEAAWTYLEAR